MQLHANERKDIPEVKAGEIAAIVGPKGTITGDTLCDETHPIVLEAIMFPEPVIRVAIEPKTKQDQDKMGIALGKLMDEDPTFRVHSDPETGQTIIAGMGELHLEVLVDRLMREIAWTPTSVGRRWPIARRSPSRPGRASRSRARPVVAASTAMSGSGGAIGAGLGVEFERKTVGGTVPREYAVRPKTVYAKRSKAA